MPKKPRNTYAFDISVILNVHRESIFLQRTKLSLLEAVAYARDRAGLTFEIVIVLDNSDTATSEWIKSQTWAEFDGVQIVEVSNGSLALSRNSGIKVARGEYVTTSDADDLVSFNMFAELHAEARKLPEKSAVFPEFVLAFGSVTHLCQYFESARIPIPGFFDYHPYISRIFIRTKDAQARPYKHADHRNGYAYEDWWFNCELISEDFTFLIARDTTLYYRQRSGSLLREAHATSARVIHANRLFEPSLFVEKARQWVEKIPDGMWTPPAPETVRSAFFDNPVIRLCAQAANQIDPAVEFNPALGDIFTNLHANAAGGTAYFHACNLKLYNDYSDVVLMPFLTAGGAEKYILNLLNGLHAIDAGQRFLILLGDAAEGRMWQDRLPPNCDVIDVYDVCDGDTKLINLVTLRLIEFAGSSVRVHLKTSPYAHRFLEGFGKLLRDQKVIYYRFSDSLIQAQGAPWISGTTFNLITDNLNEVDLFLSDHHAIIETDRHRTNTQQEKWQCLYTQCILPPQQWAPPKDGPKIRLLWASRLAPEKRPEMLLKLMGVLAQTMPSIEVDIYGNLDPGYIMPRLQGNVRYSGGFSDFNTLPLNTYSAFLYTSHYDGLPNVILEAMAGGLPVIAPAIGGISETIEDGANGWLVHTTGDDDHDAQAYADVIGRIDFSQKALSRVGANARTLISERHSRLEFLKRISHIFDISTPLDAPLPLTPQVQAQREAQAYKRALNEERARAMTLAKYYSSKRAGSSQGNASHRMIAHSGDLSQRLAETERELEHARLQLNARTLRFARFIGRITGYDAFKRWLRHRRTL